MDSELMDVSFSTSWISEIPTSNSILAVIIQELDPKGKMKECSLSIHILSLSFPPFLFPIFYQRGYFFPGLPILILQTSLTELGSPTSLGWSSVNRNLVIKDSRGCFISLFLLMLIFPMRKTSKSYLFAGGQRISSMLHRSFCNTLILWFISSP